MSGYDQDFLGVPVPLPGPGAGRVVRELAYSHFTVLLEPARQLAAATGVNIAGSELRDVERTDGWRLDPRVDEGEQAGADLYTGNELDRGHMVRRSDPVWGAQAVAEQANADTFVYPNAAPQAAEFNQSKQLWLGLEDYVLNHADTYDTRLSVFTAPVLAEDDPVYRGVGIPRSFWKVAAWSTTSAAGEGRSLAATGYVLDQTPQLDDIDVATRRALQAGGPPPLGPYRTYQVPIADVGALTGLDLGPLVGADRFPVPAAAGDRWQDRWVRLDALSAMRL
ncbi:DNA/RNA endonuclease [Pseudonocardia sp. MH-G8]|nr:DNA/RNA endonuclease [Pseudonocardia sp. MH-G8]